VVSASQGIRNPALGHQFHSDLSAVAHSIKHVSLIMANAVSARSGAISGIVMVKQGDHVLRPEERSMAVNAASSHPVLPAGAFSAAAVAAIVGPLAYVVVTLFHPPGAPANDHPTVFREYAMSQTWIAIHLLQLAGLVLALIGIAGLAGSILRLQPNGHGLALLALGFAVCGVPLAAVLQAVDGITQKRMVDAWVGAGGTVDSAHFAAAQAVRWLEEGVNAVFSLDLSVTVILVGAAMLRGPAYPRWLGWVAGAIGVAVLFQAVLVAETGFSPAAQTWILARNPGLWIWTAVAGVLLWRRCRLLDAGSSPATYATGRAER
jgi:hypothetical protein